MIKSTPAGKMSDRLPFGTGFLSCFTQEAINRVSERSPGNKPLMAEFSSVRCGLDGRTFKKGAFKATGNANNSNHCSTTLATMRLAVCYVTHKCFGAAGRDGARALPIISVWIV